MNMTNPRSEAARLLGSIKSEAKTRAARENARKPRKKKLQTNI